MHYSLEEKAKLFARQVHHQADQKRKYSNAPYIVHPQAVAELIRHTGADEAMLAAAWLHDTLEDTPTTFGQLQQLFGQEVAVLVEMLTNPQTSENDTRLQKKQRHLQHTAKACAKAQTIKLADIIDNTKDIVDNDPEFAPVYLVEKQIQIELLRDGDPGLWQQAEAQISHAIARLCQPPYNMPASWFTHQTEKYLSGPLTG